MAESCCQKKTPETQGKTELTYDSYLHVTQLLDCMKPKTTEDNEKLFIMIHQVFELWFRQVLDDIDLVRDTLSKKTTERELLTLIKPLQRVVMIFKLVTQQFAIMETMTPMEFMDFRGVLSPASGFQSLQFRQIEISLGIQDDDRLKYADKPYTEAMDEASKKGVADAVKKRSLLTVLGAWLEKTPGLNDDNFPFVSEFKTKVTEWKEEHNDNYDKSGFAAVLDEAQYDADKKANKRRLSHKAFLGALLTFLYRHEPVFNTRYTILSLIMDIEGGLWQWRSNHVMMVHRMIGRKPGTGGKSGISGVDYLQETMAGDRYRIFADLFNVTTYLVPSEYIPPLPAHLKESLAYKSDC